jgi:hypothetical protein
MNGTFRKMYLSISQIRSDAFRDVVPNRFVRAPIGIPNITINLLTNYFVSQNFIGTQQPFSH